MRRYGWDEGWQRLREEAGLADSLPARVARTDRGRCRAFSAEGEINLISDSQRSQAAISPTTGDWVLYSRDHHGEAVIDTVLERRTSIVRRDPADLVVKQTLAANMDAAAVFVGLDEEVNPAQVERFLILAVDSGAEVVLVMSKADLLEDPQDRLAARRCLEEAAPDVEILETSSMSGWGLEQLRAKVSGNRTLALLGPSGVGKSTLANALLGERSLSVGEMRAGGAGGRHTTVARELVILPDGGMLLDSPGLRAVGLWEADIALDVVFSDIADLAAGCRFRNCTHRSEPDCAVVAAVVDGQVESERLARYQRLWNEVVEQSAARTERVRIRSRGKRGRKERRRFRRR